MSDAMPRPWTVVRKGTPKDLGIVKFRQDLVADPRNGNQHPRLIVEATDWVNVIPMTRDGHVVLIRQFRFGSWSTSLEIPGGMVDPGEEPEAAAIRELDEETGYRPEKVIALGNVHPNPAFMTNRCHTFLALDCERAHAGRQETDEDIAIELRRRDEITGLILSGEITHSLVVAAFYLDDHRRG